MKYINYKLFLIIVWIFIIFLFSNDTKVETTKKSNAIIDNTVVRVYDKFDSNKSKKEIRDNYAYPIRKIAHIIEYLILGILIYLYIKDFFDKYIIISIIICLIISILDEYHQFFIPGRTNQLKDIFIDSFGSILGILFINKIKKNN